MFDELKVKLAQRHRRVLTRPKKAAVLAALAEYSVHAAMFVGKADLVAAAIANGATHKNAQENQPHFYGRACPPRWAPALHLMKRLATPAPLIWLRLSLGAMCSMTARG